MRIVDIGANLLDDMFKGVYNGRQCHPNDLQSVLARAHKACLTDILVTAGSVEEAERAQELILLTVDQPRINLQTTAGIHPTRATQTLRDDPQYRQKLLKLAESPQVVAIGECGLDYCRQFSSEQDQTAVFKEHFELAKLTGKPMFLHLRDAFDDFYRLIVDNRAAFTGGVVHSFDGTVAQALQLVDLQLYIGINGCSVKQEEGLMVVKAVPLEWLLLESDAPWCEMRPTHASFKHVRSVPPKKDKDKWEVDCWVKGRNEPAACLDLIHLIADVKGLPVDIVSETIYQNTVRLFNLK